MVGSEYRDVRRVPIPGDRDVTASLDEPAGDAGACVVACPPHPQRGGSRSDRRLQAVGDALADCGVACLRFDYGPWDEGEGERQDAVLALAWAAERYERLGLFGYSFGGGVALLAGIDHGPNDEHHKRPAGEDVAGLATLAPAAALPDGSDAAAATEDRTRPTLVVVGERDETVAWERVAERARGAGHVVEAFPADHRFAGHQADVAGAVASFLAEHLDIPGE